MARILVVDDEPGVLGFVVNALSLRGHDVHAASSSLQALQLAHREPCFDLVVSDVIMPDMCGPELIRRITPMCPDAAVILMSGHIAAEALPAHTKFISKPFRMLDLFSIVDGALAPQTPGAAL